jgi:putative transposase
MGLRSPVQRPLGSDDPEGRAGSALDNAIIESWHSTLEFELCSLEHFTSRAEARAGVAAWIDDYNRHRRHSALQMRSPIDFELGPRAA